ncbi:MAG: hypothetical protein RL394_758, partial [Bacteroidota bacterium]
MVFQLARPFLVLIGMMMTMGVLAQGNITYDLIKPK